ncbi:MAG: 50S ribosomal protein L4 [Deltaproteobacteria bacterium]|nr:50S ribosomal protein L4 [Deltaproteobacteria bacterium]
MTRAVVYNAAKEPIGELELSEAVFGRKDRLPLVFEAVQAHRTNARQGTAATKVRSEVRGGGKKPYRQKGTGNARHGSLRSPLFVGGGAVFGPHPREFRHRIPRQAKRAALCSALSRKQREGKVMVVDRLHCETPKTKPMAAVLRALGVASGLIVLEGVHAHVQRSLRNIPRVKVIAERGLNVYDVLRYEHIVFTKAAMEQFAGRMAPCN